MLPQNTNSASDHHQHLHTTASGPALQYTYWEMDFPWGQSTSISETSLEQLEL